VADTYGFKIVYPGTVLSKVTGTHLPTYGQCMERVSAPTYGPGSDVAIGLLVTLADLTYGPVNVGYIDSGRARESRCKDVGTVGTVAAATKTALTHIVWI